MEKYERIKLNRKEIMLNNFLGGVAWGTGATIGLSFFLTLVGLIVKKVGLIPIVGSFVSDIISFVLQNNPNLLK